MRPTMTTDGDGPTAECDWCGHVVAVSRLAKFDAEEGQYRYACPSCSIKVDPHTLRIGEASNKTS